MRCRSRSRALQNIYAFSSGEVLLVLCVLPFDAYIWSNLNCRYSSFNSSWQLMHSRHTFDCSRLPTSLSTQPPFLRVCGTVSNLLLRKHLALRKRHQLACSFGCADTQPFHIFTNTQHFYHQSDSAQCSVLLNLARTKRKPRKLPELKRH